MKRRIGAILVILLLAVAFGACAESFREGILCEDGVALTDELMVEYGYYYYSPEEVALYLCAFEELPENFITKNEARKLGWNSSQGNLWDVAEGMCIGGDRFGNREGLLPEKRGRQWYEADLNYEGGYRGGERLLFSNDGIICYSSDHYNSYETVYGGWLDPDGWYREESNNG